MELSIVVLSASAMGAHPGVVAGRGAHASACAACPGEAWEGEVLWGVLALGCCLMAAGPLSQADSALVSFQHSGAQAALDA